MKLMRHLLTIAILAGIGMSLIVSRPTESDFAKWYVEQNQTGLGGFFDEAFNLVIQKRTETKDYLLFSVFEIDGEDRYIGVWGHIFGRGSEKQMEKTLSELIDQVKDNVDGKDK